MPAWRANGMRGPKTRTEASMKTSRSGRKNWHSKVVFSAAMLLASTAVWGRAIVVKEGESIQAAVDLAQPGDRIIVMPGLYTGVPGYDAVVTVTKDDITIQGSKHAVIDATGFEYGIMVGEDVPIGPAGCPAPTVRNFNIIGLTIQNAEDTGLRLVGVDGFRITHGRYLDNEEYGPFPVCSSNGLISHNFAAGHNDAAIYVGDDDQVEVLHNVVIGNAIGIEIENSTNASVRFNLARGNTAGILIIVLPGLPVPLTDNVVVENNTILNNNFPNPVPADSGDPVGILPTGTGILNVGGDRVSIRKNVIVGNDSFGLAIIGNFFAFFDPRIEPFVDGNEVRRNVILANGANPDPERALTPGVDIVFIPDVLDPATGDPVLPDPDPTDNCFQDNRFETDFPPGVTGFFPCPD